MYQNQSDDRPWGSWELIVDHRTWAVKILRVAPGGILSLQRHQFRREIWTPLETGLVTNVGDTVSVLEKGHRVVVPAGTVHRISNPTDREIAIVEVITGYYDENDIERLDDIYGRG